MDLKYKICIDIKNFVVYVCHFRCQDCSHGVGLRYQFNFPDKLLQIPASHTLHLLDSHPDTDPLLDTRLAIQRLLQWNLTCKLPKAVSKK